MEQCIAFGDNYNDSTLLEQVGIGVAVANAKPKVLKIADVVTEKNTEDGVANYLEKYWSNSPQLQVVDDHFFELSGTPTVVSTQIMYRDIKLISSVRLSTIISS